jgi:hypothetical protein
MSWPFFALKPKASFQIGIGNRRELSSAPGAKRDLDNRTAAVMYDEAITAFHYADEAIRAFIPVRMHIALPV